MSSNPAGYHYDYTDSFEAPIATANDRTPEQWARAVFEHAPRPVRRLLVSGFRYGLGLRLGPRPSPEHVLGWEIVQPETRLDHDRVAVVAPDFPPRVPDRGVTRHTIHARALRQTDRSGHLAARIDPAPPDRPPLAATRSRTGASPASRGLTGPHSQGPLVCRSKRQAGGTTVRRIRKT